MLAYCNSPVFSRVFLFLAKTAQPSSLQGEKGVPSLPPGTHWAAGTEHVVSLSLMYTVTSSPADWRGISGGNLHLYIAWASCRGSPVSREKAMPPTPYVTIIHLSMAVGKKKKSRQVNELSFSALSPFNSETGNMSNLQHLIEKESSCFILLWPVTILNNDMRMCWDKQDEVL